MKNLYNKINELGIYDHRITDHTKKYLRDVGLYDPLIEATKFLTNPTLAEMLYVLRENILSSPMCAECGTNPVSFITITKGYRSFCSKSCQSKSPMVRSKVKSTVHARYGVNNVFQIEETRKKAITGTKSKAATIKRQETCLKKWGVEHNSQSDEIKDKKTKTIRKKYGVNHTFQSPSIQEKAKATCIEKYGNEHYFGSNTGKLSISSTIKEKYGVDYYIQSDEFRTKSKDTLQKNYGVDNPSKSAVIIDKIKNSHIQRYGAYYPTLHISLQTFKKLQNKDWLIDQHHNQLKPINRIADELGDVTHKTVWNYFISHEIKINRGGVSKQEIEIKEYVESLGIKNIIISDRLSLEGKELDIYLPDYNLAIEFNGNYWHSSIFKDQYYHVDKFLLAKEKGIHLIQIFEDEWKNKRSIIKSRLRSLVGKNKTIYARKCKIEELSSKSYRKFIDQYHLQGYTPAKFKYGLFFKNELVAIMSFSKSRYTKDQFELIRYCSVSTVVGGASKLFKHFIKEISPTNIVSYADRCWSNGDLYFQLQFENITTNYRNVGYWYIVNDTRYHRSNFTKKKLIHMGHDASLTESQIMESINAMKIYNCGQWKFLWTLPTLR